MNVSKCTPAAETYDLTWSQVHRFEGVYKQTGNTEGYVVVLGPGALENTFVAVWNCGGMLSGYEGGHPDTRFRRINNVKVCFDVQPIKS